MRTLIWTLLVLVGAGSLLAALGSRVVPEDRPQPIGGVSLVSPPRQVDGSWTGSVRQINAGWVAVMPYGFSYAGSPEVNYNLDRQWWGERFDGMRQLIRQGKEEGLKVMLKPMVWVMGGWPGGYDLGSEEEWKQWEQGYSQYILETARIAREEKVDIFCVGTEFKIAAQTREKFWRKLIREVRKEYSGPVTYAANWDEYEGVRFWDAVDVVGIDAYFPLSDEKTPSVERLKREWKGPAQKMAAIYKLLGKRVLFTEFGYRSIDHCSWRQWELEGIPYTQQVNLEAQVNAYQAFFETFWDQPWFAGVFVWQWYTHDDRAGGVSNSDYTPQNKPAEELIGRWYGE